MCADVESMSDRYLNTYLARKYPELVGAILSLENDQELRLEFETQAEAIKIRQRIYAFIKAYTDGESKRFIVSLRDLNNLYITKGDYGVKDPKITIHKKENVNNEAK